MALRVDAGQARQLLALRTEALIHSEAAAAAAAAPAAEAAGAAPPSVPARAGAASKEAARLRAALAVSEDQRRRDGEAAEKAAAVLRAEIERLRARRPGTAPPGPTTPDRRSAPPARRGSASSGRSEDPSAGPPEPTAGHRWPGPPALAAAPADHLPFEPASLDLDHRRPDAADGADMAPAELDDMVMTHQAEVAKWHEHCAALEGELRWLRAMAAQNRLPEPAEPLRHFAGGNILEVFPLDRYLSTSPPGGLSIQSAWQQLAADPAASHTFPTSLQLPSSETASQRQLGNYAGSCGASSASVDSDGVADADMDALLQSLEAAVLKSSPATQVCWKNCLPTLQCFCSFWICQGSLRLASSRRLDSQEELLNIQETFGCFAEQQR